MSWRPRTGDDRGQVTTALVVAAVVVVAAVAFTGTVLVSRGVDDKTGAQGAADAAALAAVGGSGVRNNLESLLAGLGRPADLDAIARGCSDVGRAQAEDYAQRNGAHLIDYCFDQWTGRARTRVEMDHPVSSTVGPATASATAESGLDLGSCGFTAAPTPTPSPTPTEKPGKKPSDGPTTPPPPPPDGSTTLSCGPLKVVFTVDGSTGLFTGTPQISLDLEPRLVD